MISLSDEIRLDKNLVHNSCFIMGKKITEMLQFKVPYKKCYALILLNLTGEVLC